MARRFSGWLEVLQADGRPAARAQGELVVDALDLGLEEWEGALRQADPAEAVQAGGRYLLRLPNGSQGEVLVTKGFPGGVWQLLGQGPPPEVPT